MASSSVQRLSFVVTSIGAALLCTSCATSRLEATPPPMPAAYEYALAQPQAMPEKDWYRAFGSEELVALIGSANEANLDLAAAQSRIRQADARARAAGAALLPTLDASLKATYITGRAGGETAYETDSSALLSASYEVDFWGRNRAASQSARLQASASRADRDVIGLTTVTGVANAYFQILSVRERLVIANSNLETTRQVLQVIQARYDAGVASPVELATQRAAEAYAALTIPPLQQSEVELRAELALLLGRRPEDFNVSGREIDSITEPSVGAGLPSELLLRRPDIQSAEMNLQASHADLNAARAALFPSLMLTASGGVQNPGVQAAVTTLTGTGYTFTAGAALAQSIFDGGRRRAVRAEAAAREAELLSAYHATILGALRDVEVALASMQHLNAQRDAQVQNVQQSQLAFDGAQSRYREGSGDFLTVLDAQRTLYSARELQSQYRLARLQAVIGVYKALGGGWRDAGATNH